MPNSVWNKILKGIQSRVPTTIFEMWFRPLKPCGKEGNILRVQTPNSMFKDWIISNYMEIIRDSVRSSGLGSISVEFIDPDSDGELVLAPPKPAKTSKPHQETSQDLPESGDLNPKYRFSHFVVGPSNQFAHAAATAVSHSPSKAYNPLYIYGGVGLGKTHLVQSIGWFIRENLPNLKVAYLPAERFMNEMISSIGNRTQVGFRDKYRQLDVLLLDDIQFVAGKMGTQEELFHTFNALHEGQKQVVISSDCHPRELQNMEERLRSRFEWGLIADIQPPDIETKVAILYEKAKNFGTSLPEDVALLIAGKIKSNIRELEGYLLRLMAYSSFKGKPVSMELALDTFQGLPRDDSHAVTIEAIQKHVAASFKMKVSELKSKTNKAAIVLPRQVAMYICKELTSASLPEIGEKFGGKHHSTVLHSVRKVNERMLHEPEFQQQVSVLLRFFQ